MRWVLPALVASAALGGCKTRKKGPEYNVPIIGAPALKPSSGPMPLMRDGGDRYIPERQPGKMIQNFRDLDAMERFPEWKPLAALIRQRVARTYRAAPKGAKPRPPYRITVTRYRVPGLPAILGVDFEAYCGAGAPTALAYVERHLLLYQAPAGLRVAAWHRPECGSVGDRFITFRDLVADGRAEAIDTYVEETEVGDDFQQIQVFSLDGATLRRLADIRVESPRKYFDVAYRRRANGTLDIVTKHLLVEKVPGRLRAMPCWRYRYFLVTTTHRFDPGARVFRPHPPQRRVLRNNEALDLVGGDLPVGNCGG